MTSSEPASPFQARLEARAGQLDAAYRAALEAAALHLRQSGMADHAKGTADRAPDFALLDDGNRRVILSELLRNGPVVLSFFRGEWCSFCRLEIEALLDILPELDARRARLVLIAPQRLSESLLGRSASLENLHILKDPMNGVGLRYGLVFRVPDGLRQSLLSVGIDLSHICATNAWLLPIPATYVIRPDGFIALAHVDPDFTRRLDPGRILAALEDVRSRFAR
ncbi:MAG TPA: peroxiredoxin-like family protein [Microvirga sp.]|jgi:peroxiredoxin|nr:peroxiredoxin-like family protein [Microvirga sp.]